jgi:hypothetical protein
VLADSIPVQHAEDGIGPMERKRFWAEISGSRLPAAD